MTDLTELSARAKQLHEQLKALKSREAELTAEVDAVENEIKARLEESNQEFANLTEAEFQAVMAELSDPMKLTVEVVYAAGGQQFIEAVQLARGANIEDGILMSGVLDKCPEIDLSVNTVGVHGSVRRLSDEVADGDRIEIYRRVVAEG